MMKHLSTVGMVIAACMAATAQETTPPLLKAGKAPQTAATLLNVFPASVVQMPPERQGRTELSSTYAPSGSSWGEHLDEKMVFLHEMKHVQDKENSFGLRIGKGGQLYSLRGAFGESIPPQGLGNPWNDEVWQSVAVCNEYNGGPDLKQLPEETVKRINRFDYARTYFIHNSGAYIPARVDSGTVTLSLDVMLDKEQPGQLDVIMRDTVSGQPWITFGTLHVTNGTIAFGETRVAAYEPGAWVNIALSFELGEGDASRRATITTRPAGGEATIVEAPFAGLGFKAFTWLGLSAGAEHDGTVYVDNLALERVTDEFTEWPIKEDFEAWMPFPVVGPAESVSTTDKVAASGRRSLQIRDSKSMEHDWQPMLRIGVQTTKSDSLYCPLLASDIPSDGRTFRTVNWGIVPQLRTICRSPVLYYVQTRDVGDGVIEITYVIHNFSVRDDVSFRWLNAPWGGTRVTSLPHHYMSSPENVLMDREWVKANCGAIGVRKTGGWNLSTVTEEPDSPSLSLVFGRDKHLEKEKARRERGEYHCQIDESIYRHMGPIIPDDWKTRPEHTFRNYEVAVVIPKLNLDPGTTIWYRSYLVVNKKSRTVELAKSLVDQVDYGYCEFDPASTPKAPVRMSDSKVVDTGSEPAFQVFAHPVPGTMPLFVIEQESTGREVITTDPYIFVPQEKLNFGLPADHAKADFYNNAVGYSLDENDSKWKRLLGYGYKTKPEGGDYVRLSEVLGQDQFPEPGAFHLDLWVERGKSGN